MRSKSSSGITLLEILAVLLIIAIIAGFTVGAMNFGGHRMRSQAQRLVGDIQAAHFQSLKQSKVFRLSISEEGSGWKIERFQIPPPPPSEEDVEAYREWKEAEEEKQRALDQLSLDERQQLNSLDRGSFELFKEYQLPDGIKVSRILHRQPTNQSRSLLFYPTGEMQAALLVLENDAQDFFSIQTNSVTGQIRSQKGLISEEEWKDGSKTK
ncbi:MAG: pilus assembly FimT family protein [Bdellovibrionota bacterium]